MKLSVAIYGIKSMQRSRARAGDFWWCFLIAFVVFIATQSVTMANELEEKLAKAVEAGELAGLHSVLVIHRGEVLAEKYFAGGDERRGRYLGRVQHRPQSLHDLRSVTKSVTGLLYGIALAEGLVPELNESVVAQFPEYPDLAGDEARQAILVRHALTMTMGTEWNEDLPYTDPRNSEIAMEMARDRYRFVLDRPMEREPGEKWDYNGGATAIIARLIAKGTGKPIDVFAKEKIYSPLGIDEFEWVKGRDGEPSAASGLRLRIGDLAKIGTMILDGGRWQGRQVVPEEWLSASFTPQTSAVSGLRYGLFWWLGPEGSPPTWVAGFGNGGQRLSVSQVSQLVVVVFAGNYNQPDAWKVPYKVIVDHVLPAIQGR